MSNLPPGVSVSDIPGFGPGDEPLSDVTVTCVECDATVVFDEIFATDTHVDDGDDGKQTIATIEFNCPNCETWSVTEVVV